mmetsp:Transcript_25124/g.39166  ORF Transcript_25124/g.39166 Transcript_25124/m.39166 type:complete len:286 (-) Transcript_25124:61-918(-)|eukprot:CAMPEP_0201515038 /NCGR_PEP_ID=MMETSP0161_2-20130828/6710_1 /ASSEMBLY_ACC=CAM_ASM_000251 /TAXON_ID=180227 /ORGANISM="Neoparamoeba aestuarina, Strain SoJaBio B1-5/56/2" /LENGTH=285 /DNA_ID=CAMNT_0047911745 /DNA_START=181 /DNA_END=1038 /DNA_ORIENTATION=+
MEDEPPNFSDWLEGQMKEAKDKYPEHAPEEWERMEAMFEILQGKTKPSFQHQHQRPYSFYLPKLPYKMFWNKEALPLTAILEENYEKIKEELFENLEKEEKSPGYLDFTPYVGDGTEEDKGKMVSAGSWNVLYFYHNFMPNVGNMGKFPVLTSVLKQFGEEFLGGMVCFSSIEPGTCIVPHTGPSNMRLTCHLGIVGCQNVEVQVGVKKSFYQDAKCVVFDDSFIHQVQHKGTDRRITLMLDCWHPSLTPLEKSVWSGVMQNVVRDDIPRDIFFHSMGLYDIRAP